MQALGIIIDTWFLFIAALPLCGLTAGVCIFIFAPYLLGKLLTAALFSRPNPPAFVNVTLAWLFLTLAVRLCLGKRLKVFAWPQGHYKAAVNLLAGSFSGAQSDSKMADQTDGLSQQLKV